MVIRITRDAFSTAPATQLCQLSMTVASTGAIQERMVRYYRGPFFCLFVFSELMS